MELSTRSKIALVNSMSLISISMNKLFRGAALIVLRYFFAIGIIC